MVLCMETAAYNPIIASVTKLSQLEAVRHSRVERVNLMAGDIVNLNQILKELHRAGKRVYIHVDMIGGLGRDRTSITFLKREFAFEGIITTRANVISAAKQEGLRAIQRIFAIDTTAMDTAIKMIHQSCPDEVELMPGLMPRIARELKQSLEQPLIVGGLIRYQEEIEACLNNGASYVSIGDESFWC